jgi:hypothetical protein
MARHCVAVILVCSLILASCSGLPNGASNNAGSGSGNGSSGGGSTSTNSSIAFVQAASFTAQTANSASSYTVTFSNNVTTGDLIVLAFWWNYPSGAAIQAINDTGGNSYQQAVSTPPSNNQNAWIYYAVPVTGGSSFSVNVDVSMLNTGAFSMVALEYAGLTTLDATSSGSGNMTSNSTTSSSGSAPTHYANELIVGVSLSSAQNTTMVGSGFTSRFSSNYFMVEDETVSATGTYAAEFFLPTGCTACTWQAGMATFH